MLENTIIIASAIFGTLLIGAFVFVAVREQMHWKRYTNAVAKLYKNR